MWLTGFDAPTVSTLYLDKPQKDHTLMQTIARANRVTSVKIGGVEKRNGEIIDYYGVFRNMKKALKDYGQGGAEEKPVENKARLLELLDDAITQAVAFCQKNGVLIDGLLERQDVFKKLEDFNRFADILISNDETRKGFAVHENTITSLYEAAKPQVLGKPVVREVAVFQYLRGVMDAIILQQDVDAVSQKIINRYNEAGSSSENYFDELMKHAKEMKAEDERHTREGLTEDELEIFGLLKKAKMGSGAFMTAAIQPPASIGRDPTACRAVPLSSITEK